MPHLESRDELDQRKVTPFLIDLTGLPPKSWACVSEDDGKVIAVGTSRRDVERQMENKIGGMILNVWVHTHPIC